MNPAGWSNLARGLAGAPVDGASVAAFRVIFGLIGVLVVACFFAHGWIGPLYVETDHHFAYRGELVEPRCARHGVSPKPRTRELKLVDADAARVRVECGPRPRP